MTQSQVEGIARHVLTAASGIGSTLGFLSDNVGAQITSVVIGLIGFIWSIKSKSKPNT